jgi:hypothetical protein
MPADFQCFAWYLLQSWDFLFPDQSNNVTKFTITISPESEEVNLDPTSAVMSAAILSQML